MLEKDQKRGVFSLFLEATVNGCNLRPAQVQHGDAQSCQRTTLSKMGYVSILGTRVRGVVRTHSFQYPLILNMLRWPLQVHG